MVSRFRGPFHGVPIYFSPPIRKQDHGLGASPRWPRPCISSFSTILSAILLPHRPLGFVPAALAIPPLLGFMFLKNRTPMSSPARQAQLALFGGATLFFLTLIFPIQFERQWITVGWALEGAALCWLFRKIPHPGLRLVGVALLLVVFARLALNPAVLSYHPRSTVPILQLVLLHLRHRHRGDRRSRSFPGPAA